MIRHYLFITLILSLSFSSFSKNLENMDISDEERLKALNYQSQEVINEKLEKLCAPQDFERDEDDNLTETPASNDISRYCRGEEVEAGGLSESTVAAASKAYSTMSNYIASKDIMGKMTEASEKKKSKTPETDKKPKTENKAPEEPNKPEKPEGAENADAGDAEGKKEEEFIDICGYVGGGAETISGFQQAQYQEYLTNLPIDADNQQTEALHKTQRLYREKARNSKINSVGWGGSTTCYAGSFVASPPVTPMGWVGRVLKFGATGVLTVYNGLISKQNREASDQVGRVIVQMPGRGECNPVTERHCFCSLKENLNNTEYCLPDQRSILARQYGTQVVCLDRFRRPDDDCSCIPRGDCFDQTFMSAVNGLEYGESWEQLNQKASQTISRGQLGRSDGQLASLSDQALRNAKGP